jgi:hypothetical protein
MMGRQSGQESRTVQTRGHGSHSGAPFYSCGVTLARYRPVTEPVFNTLIDRYKKGDRKVTFFAEACGKGYLTPVLRNAAGV